MDRAYSHFLMNRSRGCEPLEDFEKALAAWDERKTRRWGWDWDYVGAGLYHDQVKRYLDAFPPEQLKVFLYEDLTGDRERFFEELFSHIGVGVEYRPDTSSRHRKATLPGSYAMQAALRNRVSVEPRGPLRRFARRVAPKVFKRQVASLRNLASTLRARVAALNAKEPEPLTPDLRARLFDRYFSRDVERLEHLIARDLSPLV